MHERLGRIVKRLKNNDDGKLQFAGDNPQSTSSEAIGFVSQNAIIGKAIFVISPNGLKRLSKQAL